MLKTIHHSLFTIHCSLFTVLLTPFSLLLTFLFLSCSKPLEPDYSGRIEFKILASSCTEVWIEVKRGVDLEGGQFQIKRGDSIVFSFRLYGQDTIVVDEGLYPGRLYRYELFYSGRFVSSGQIRTLDTTSHEFEWRIFEFGDPTCGSSSFYDVSVVNDTLIYAVGEIYMRDSTGECDPEFYNLAIWNGREWRLKKIYVRSQAGDIHSRVFTGIIAFSANDVWFGDGNAFHWDGMSSFAQAFWISGYIGNPTPVLGPNQGVHKFWGRSSTDLYGVGVNGGIAHWDGVRWERIESGIDLPIQDIWGDGDEILCVASTVYFGGDGKVMRIKAGGVEQLNTAGLSWSLRGIWFKSGSAYYVVGSGIYRNILLDKAWVRELKGVVSRYCNKIRGNGLNDVFVVGDFGLVVHFNGLNWRLYDSLWMYGAYYSVDVKGDIVCAVGTMGGKAVALIGKRK